MQTRCPMTYADISLLLNRELGGNAQSEFTIIKTEAYNGINAYLSELSNTNVKTFEDIIDFNKENTGTEGACPGDHPAFPTGQVIDLFFLIHSLYADDHGEGHLGKDSPARREERPGLL